MLDQLPREKRAALYREFSRQKYNKYRHQFPRLRESELVSKIIKEWEAKSQRQKVILWDQYVQQKHINDQGKPSFDDRSRSPSPGSQQDEKKPKTKISFVQPLKTQGVRVYVADENQEEKQQHSDFQREQVKDFEISESLEIGEPIVKRTMDVKNKIKPLSDKKNAILKGIEENFQQYITKHNMIVESIIQLKKIDPKFQVYLNGNLFEIGTQSYGTFFKTEHEENQQKKDEQNKVEAMNEEKPILQPIEPSQSLRADQIIDLLYNAPYNYKVAFQSQQQRQVVSKSIENVRKSIQSYRMERYIQTIAKTQRQHPRWSIAQATLITKLVAKKYRRLQNKYLKKAIQKVYYNRLQTKKAKCGKFVRKLKIHEKSCKTCLQSMIYQQQQLDKEGKKLRRYVDQEYFPIQKKQIKPKKQKLKPDPILRSQSSKKAWAVRKEKKQKKLSNLVKKKKKQV